MTVSDLSKMKKVSLKSTTTPTTSPFTAAAKRNRRKPKNRDMYWRKTTEEPPKKEDADKFWNVLGWYAAAKHAGPVRWDLVALYAIDVPYWMPLPEPPKGCEPHE